jgi:hypothetical protein
MDSLLTEVSKATELKLLKIPTHIMFSPDKRNLISGKYEGKLSENGIRKFLLHDIGYPGLILFVSFSFLSSFNPNRSSTLARERPS